MSNVFPVAGGEVVDADNSIALAQQAVGEVRTKKPGGAGNKDVQSQVFMLREYLQQFILFRLTAMQAQSA
jgi:RNase H-fold protein (predicted Holliday junction resolvase)